MLGRAASMKPGGGVTVRPNVVVTVATPAEVPVMTTVDVPGAAMALAVSVSTLLPVVGLVPNDAVTPLGRPDAARLTFPPNPPTSATVMVAVLDEFWIRVSKEGETPREKPDTVRGTNVVEVREPEVPVTPTL